ncbi:MAG TPA: FAD-binding protein [Anaerolineales bacterium]|nr:FAD-binding protein [Anaerolineales bacterium]
MEPTSILELKEIVLASPKISLQGGCSKTGLRPGAGEARPVYLTSLTGLVEYEPAEYTFIAWAGTPVAEVNRVLAEHAQYLPFDPVLVKGGATLGGTVASGLSGPGRYRYGGVRDFLLGVKFMNGDGEIIQAGGKVVKNAAGFDLAKLMVGSLGQYGAMVELAFKVFPKPEDYTTILAEYPTIDSTLKALYALSSAPLEIFAIDLIPDPEGVTLAIRIGGKRSSFPDRIRRICEILVAGEEIDLEQESVFWNSATEFDWIPPGSSLVKVPVTPKKIPEFDQYLRERGAIRRYSVGGNLALVGWGGEIEPLDDLLSSLSLSGLVVIGSPPRPILGQRVGQAFAGKIKKALDPRGRWLEV